MPESVLSVFFTTSVRVISIIRAFAFRTFSSLASSTGCSTQISTSVFCYLFGSYAKGKATEVSDVDLLISTETTGLRFFEMTERLRKGLHKKVDVLDLKQLVNNEALIREVLREGVRIYRSDS